MYSNWKGLIALMGLAAVAVCPIRAQDSGALVEALVKKGVLTDQEGEEIRADLTKEYASTSAGKLNVGSHIKQLRIYGDGRWRYEYNNTDNQTGSGSTSTWRARYRIRLGIDYAFRDNFSGGFELESSTQNDGAMQTIGSGFGKFSINVGLLYLTYKPWDFATLTGGKIKNPFYTTDMLWDPDVNPEGAAEIFNWDVDDSVKVGLTLGQFNYTENTDSLASTNANASKDSWIFAAQTPITWKAGKDVTVVVAPSGYLWTPGSTTTPSTGSPAFIDVNGASYLNILAMPGEVGFKLFSQKAKFYWDLVYNVTGKQRIEQAYAAYSSGSYNPATYRAQNLELSDNAAWLVGLKLGDNKKKGDWAVSADFRQVGLGAVDPNLADSEWGNGFPNQQGVKLTAAYNFTDFFIGGVNYYTTWNYKENLALPTGSAGNSLTTANSTQRFQVEATWKF